jgi:hypothetical protein
MRPRQWRETTPVVAGIKFECDGFELTVLNKYGLNSSRLDDRESITRLVKNDGLSVVKPALTSVAGVVTNGPQRSSATEARIRITPTANGRSGCPVPAASR